MGFLCRLLVFGFLSDAMAVCVSGQDQGQSTISGHVTCSTEAVLQSEDGQHQSSTGVVEQQDTSDQSQRGHTVPPGTPGAPMAKMPSSTQNRIMVPSDGIEPYRI